eukprot:g1075.t1
MLLFFFSLHWFVPLSFSQSETQHVHLHGEYVRTGPKIEIAKRERPYSPRDLQGIQAQYCLISAAGLTDHLRNCLQTCHVLDDVIEPRFTQFESFCVESAADPLWPDPCYDFFECVLGCKITQEITKGKTIDTIKPGDREDYFGRIDPGNVEAEQRCLIEKCRSYCVRQRLGTCHEMGYIRACEAAQRGQYLPCDVNCNSAVGRKGAAGIVVGAVFAAAGLWFVAM